MGLRSRFLPAGGFAENVLTVTAGVAVAQAIPLAAAPILTRLYTPADFGVFGLYLSLTGVLSTVATARYELAILLPETDEDAFNLAALSILIAAGVCLLTFLALRLLRAPIAALLGDAQISPWLDLAPLSIFLAGVFQTLDSWSLRRKRFGQLAVRKVNYFGSMTFSQIGLGRIGAGAGGLLVGQVVGAVFATGFFAGAVLREDWRRFKDSLKRDSIRGLLWRYRAFPQYDVASSLLNNLSKHLPTIVFSVFFGPAVAGFYALTQTVLGMPVSLLAEPIRAAFKQRASSDFLKDGNCRAIYARTFAGLLALAVPPFALLALFAPPLFTLAFGEQWRTAGEYARTLAGLYFVQFVASPLSYTLFVAEKQRLHLLWQVGLFVSTAAALLFGVLRGSAQASLSAFAGAYVALYLVSLGLSYRCAGSPRP